MSHPSITVDQNNGPSKYYSWLKQWCESQGKIKWDIQVLQMIKTMAKWAIQVLQQIKTMVHPSITAD